MTIFARAGANNTTEIDLRDIGTLYLIPLAIVQVANQTLAGFTEPVSLERRYPAAGGQKNCTGNPGTEELKKNRDPAPEHTQRRLLKARPL